MTAALSHNLPLSSHCGTYVEVAATVSWQKKKCRKKRSWTYAL